MISGIFKGVMALVIFLAIACGSAVKNSEENYVLYIDTLINDDQVEIGFKRDSIHVLIAKNKIAQISWNKNGFVPEKSLQGIYVLENGKLLTQTVLITSDKIFFTVPDEQLRGYLYIISRTKGSLTIDKKFNREFIVSNSGVFFIDDNKKRAIVIEKPVLDSSSDEMITPLKSFDYSTEFFEYKEEQQTPGELIYNDSLLHAFFEQQQK